MSHTHTGCVKEELSLLNLDKAEQGFKLLPAADKWEDNQTVLRVAE